MWLIILEALAALCLLIGIVWWTMFSGRPRGELPVDDAGASGRTSATRPEGQADGVSAPAPVTQRSSSDAQQ